MQKYYLDTNTVYNIKKLPSSILKNSFTSIFTMLEILSGIKDEGSYKQRKSVLVQLLQSKIDIDYLLPDELKFQSFDCYIEDFDFIEQRTASFIKLVNSLASSSTYNQYKLSAEYNAALGHQYFKDIDDHISNHFITSTINGVKEVEKILGNNPSEQTVSYKGVTYKLNSTKEIHDFFKMNSEINQAFTVMGLCEGLIQHTKQDLLNGEQVYDSYNGLLSTFVEVYSNYCLDKLVTKGTPAKNDAADLTHLCYLRNRKIKLVSDDKIYKRYLANDNLNLAEVMNDITINLRELTIEHADAYCRLLEEQEILEEFAINPEREHIIGSIQGLNSTPDLSTTWGIFNDDELIGFAQLSRKIDVSKTHEFEETDDIQVQFFDEEYQERIRKKQLAVSPFTINIAIGKLHRNKGYGKAAMRKVLEAAKAGGISDVFLHVGLHNKNSMKLAISLGGEVVEQGVILNVFKISL